MDSNEQLVKTAYPDAEMYIALFAGGAFAVGSPSKGVTIGAMKNTREEAWADAAVCVKGT